LGGEPTGSPNDAELIIFKTTTSPFFSQRS
jgi:hypothetical protein